MRMKCLAEERIVEHSQSPICSPERNHLEPPRNLSFNIGAHLLDSTITDCNLERVNGNKYFLIITFKMLAVLTYEAWFTLTAEWGLCTVKHWLTCSTVLANYV